MPSGKKRSRTERRKRQQSREADKFNIMLKEIAEAFSCSSEIATDFADQCELNRDNLEADLAFSDLALTVWLGRPGVEDLVAALVELRETRQRYLDVMADFVRRFRHLAATDEAHVHLDSDAINPDLVHRMVFPDPPPAP